MDACPPSENKRIEVGVELATYIFRAEYLLCVPDKPQHEKPFQETDRETTDDQYVGVLGAGTDPA